MKGYFFVITSGCILLSSITPVKYVNAEEVLLKTKFPSGWHTPQWTQPDIGANYPMGCGPNAWAIVYSYWTATRQKNKLFDGYDVWSNSNTSDSSDAPIKKAMEDVSANVKTEYVIVGSKKYGRTWPKNMCDGINYAKQHGYKHSRCWQIRGTESNKYDHVKRYLKADKPSILLMKEGEHRGIANHYVVIEGARKTNDKIQYLVNFGHGADSQNSREWITVRDYGANEGDVWSSYSIFLPTVSEAPLPDASGINEEACKEWCQQNPECVKCDTKKFCGVGFSPLKDFTGAGEPGDNWHACKEQDLKAACEKWCAEHKPECVMCDTKKYCGVGYEPMKHFTGIEGTNYHACKKQSLKSECEAWCADHKPECVKCDTKQYCGVGYEPMKHFTGAGTNYHACRKK